VPLGGGGGAGPLGSWGKLLEIPPLEISELLLQKDDLQAGILEFLVQVLLPGQPLAQGCNLRGLFLLTRPGQSLRLAQSLQFPVHGLDVVALLAQAPDLLLES